MEFYLCLILVALGVITITLGLTRVDNIKMLTGEDLSVILVCMFSGGWSISYGMIGIQSNIDWLFVWRGFGIASIFGTLIAYTLIFKYWIALSTKISKYFTFYAFGGALILFPIMIDRNYIQIKATKYGTYYSLLPYFGQKMFVLYLIGYILFGFIILISIIKKKEDTNFDIILSQRLLVCLFVLVIGMLTDVIVPMLNKSVVFPISAFIQGIVIICFFGITKKAGFNKITFDSFSRYILTSIQTPVLILHGKGTIVLTNHFAADFFDLPMDQLKDKNIMDLIHREEMVFDEIPREKSFDVETNNGKECVLKLTSIQGSYGNQIGEIAVLTEVGEKTRMLREISETKNEKIDLLQEAMFQSFTKLISIKDKVTGEHVHNTMNYAKIFVEKLSESKAYQVVMTEEYIKNLLRSVSLHDMGKLGIDDAILRKCGKLTEEEFAQMKKHTVMGGDIFDMLMAAVEDMNFLSIAKNMALYHHEKWNGEGYPCGLAGEEIPLEARIMALLDVYEALTAERTYKKAFSHDKAIMIIVESAGTHFDPKLTEVFLYTFT